MIGTNKLQVILLWIFVGTILISIESCIPEPREITLETSEVLEVLECDSGKCIVKHSCGISEVDSPIIEGTTIARILDTKFNLRWHAKYNLGSGYDKEIKCTTK